MVNARGLGRLGLLASRTFNEGARECRSGDTHRVVTETVRAGTPEDG